MRRLARSAVASVLLAAEALLLLDGLDTEAEVAVEAAQAASAVLAVSGESHLAAESEALSAAVSGVLQAQRGLTEVMEAVTEALEKLGGAKRAASAAAKAAAKVLKREGAPADLLALTDAAAETFRWGGSAAAAMAAALAKRMAGPAAMMTGGSGRNQQGQEERASRWASDQQQRTGSGAEEAPAVALPSGGGDLPKRTSWRTQGVEVDPSGGRRLAMDWGQVAAWVMAETS
ncbi:hypothetical protein GPECTOR_63g65 [Gonium pectorale]|uniref:Uncharacterized protein n=1 Tax=Gonium pectorale TaxID=33097 RepID=A0A150G5Y8_GONPE|nr:hypothetical protein GPECTOR_63g65 [Gonium pectorale]|eukprot:KXZ44740.1 hypothetical protein GPECTOR_63g65 [Gonium pectorale]